MLDEETTAWRENETKGSDETRSGKGKSGDAVRRKEHKAPGRWT
jgi:hypothetical protein